MVRRSLPLLVFMLVFSAAAAFAADPCRFIVMGDNRPQWDKKDMVTPSAGYQRAIVEANLLQPDFVVIGGDLIHGYTNLAEMQQQWDAFDAATKQFEMPVYLVVGNHDVFNQESEQLYQQRYGKLWYSADVKDCHLIVLDSEDQTAPLRIAGTQLDWLRADLEAAKGKRIFVLLHQPLWPRDEQKFRESDWGRTVHPLLVAAGVDTVFAGHEHVYEMTPTRDGIRYIITGGGGAELGAEGEPLAGGFLHYVLVTVPDQGPAKLAVIHTGSVDPQDIVTTEQAARVRQFAGQFRTPALVVEDRPVTQRISFKVSNPLAQRVRGKVAFEEADGWHVAPATRTFSLASAKSTTLTFDVTADPAQATGPLPYRVAYEAEGRGTGGTENTVGLVHTVAAPSARVTVDGSLAEWTGPAPLVLNRPDQLWDDGDLWQGPESFSAQAWVAHDRDSVYVAVKVVDKQFTPTPPNAGSATGDAVVLYLDGRAASQLGRRTYAAGVGLVIAAPGAAGQPVQVFSPKDAERGLAGVRAVSQLTSDGYVVEMAVPLKDFPKRGGVLGFDLSVNDNSPDPNHPVVLFWHGDATDWKDASRFGRVRLR